MKALGAVPVERILDAFKDDQKVVKLGLPWPATLAEEEKFLRNPAVGRPVDHILKLKWGLYELDHREFFSLVRPIWNPAGMGYIWTLEEMLREYKAGRYTLPVPNSVAALEAEMRAVFRPDVFLLVGYRDFHHPPYPAGAIRLEEGHNRVTAAFNVGCTPNPVKMYLGDPP